MVYLIIDSGAAQVAHAMLVIGWGLIPITLFHLIPFTLSALSWRELLPAASRPRTVTVIWIQWILESINTLLPVASVAAMSQACASPICEGCRGRKRHPA